MDTIIESARRADSITAYARRLTVAQLELYVETGEALIASGTDPARIADGWPISGDLLRPVGGN